MERLAIEGGRPVRGELLPYGHQWLDEDDIAAVSAALREDWITQGPRVGDFEGRVAEYCGAGYAVAVASGTAALHAACLAAGVTAGNEVITSPITFAATANAAVYCGGRPVFADVLPGQPNLDPAKMRDKISPRTKAVMPVDFAGHPADMDAIKTIAGEKGLPVIEDAAHALGAEYKGRKVGCLADMTVFSFHPVKHITTGEGGMILTDDRDIYRELVKLRHHGIVKSEDPGEPWRYDITEPGYNFRITDFQCALGISQLKKLDGFVVRRREIAARYNEAFGEIREISALPEAENVKSAYHIYVIRLNPAGLKAGRREVFAALRAENIGVNVHYIPVHLLGYYRENFGGREGDCPEAERYYEEAITLPLFPKMSDADAADVINAVTKVVGHYRK